MSDAARSTHQTAVAADLDNRVLREHVASVYVGYTTAICAHMGFAIAIGIFGYFNIDPIHHLLVIGMVAAVVLVNLYALLAPRWTPDALVSESHYWARRYTCIVTLISITTALPCALFLVLIQSPEMTTLVIVVIMVSWTRAVQARWPIRQAMFGCSKPKPPESLARRCDPRSQHPEACRRHALVRRPAPRHQSRGAHLRSLVASKEPLGTPQADGCELTLVTFARRLMNLTCSS